MKFGALLAIASHLRPELATMSGLQRTGRLIDVVALLLMLPVTVIGVVWLLFVTEVDLLRREGLAFLILLLWLLLFRRYQFRLQLELRSGAFASTDGSLESLVVWSAALYFGPTALWLPLLTGLAVFAYHWRGQESRDGHWLLLRVLVVNAANILVGGLAGLWVYQRLGGLFPLSGFSWREVGPAVAATLTMVVVPLLMMLPFVTFVTSQPDIAGPGSRVNRLGIIRFVLFGSGLSALAYPFAILAAAIYALHGAGVYCFLLAGALLASVLASLLSQAVQRSQQRSRELAALEELGRAIIAAPPDASTLPDLLAAHLRGMFPAAQMVIWLLPDQILYRDFEPDPSQFAQAQQQLIIAEQPYHLLDNVRLPEDRPGIIARDGLLLPIWGEEQKPQGGIYVLLLRADGRVADFLPALQTLAAQIASAVHRAATYEQALANERMAHELEVAGHIQESFLPAEAPKAPGWEIVATLTPARQTSGDFYDFVELPDNRIGILVADVADKGTGAALYMALSRTLIRTYALAHHDQPHLALGQANERILADTDSDLFVTVFYGVLDLSSGRFIYCNAGHNPAYLFSRDDDAASVQTLMRTGMPLGIMPDAAWQCSSVQVNRGDLLLLYTDGVTEAQDESDNLYEDERLLATCRRHFGSPARDIQEAISASIGDFVGRAPQHDDITLLLVARK